MLKDKNGNDIPETKTENKDAVEVKTLLDQLMKANDTKFAEVEKNGKATEKSIKDAEELAQKLMTRIETVETKMIAPIIPANVNETKELEEFNIISKSFENKGIETQEVFKEYKETLLKYIQKGKDFIESKTLVEGIDSQGGYLVSPQMSNKIIAKVFETSPMRSISTIEKVSKDSFEYIIDFDDFDADYVCELKGALNDDTATFDKLRINVNEIAAEPKASQIVLEDSAINLESWIIRKLTNKFSRKDNANFINGTGKNEPKGLMTPIDGSVYGTVARVESTTVGKIVPNDIIKLTGELKDVYANKGKILMSRQTFYALLLQVGGDGHNIINLWSEAGKKIVPRLLGYEVIFMQDMPKTQTAGIEPVAFGDFAEGYTIVDRVGISILRDPYTSKGVIKFYARMRTGGSPTNTEAYNILKIKA